MARKRRELPLVERKAALDIEVDKRIAHLMRTIAEAASEVEALCPSIRVATMFEDRKSEPAPEISPGVEGEGAASFGKPATAPKPSEEPALAPPASAGGEGAAVSGATPADPPRDPLEIPACCDRRKERAHA